MSGVMKLKKSKEALQKFIECLRCKKCDKVVEKPMRFTTCGHFFCAKCLLKHPATCTFCGIPVKPSELQFDFIIENLVKSSIELSNLLQQSDPDSHCKLNSKNIGEHNQKEKKEKSTPRLSRRNRDKQLKECEEKSTTSSIKSTEVPSLSESSVIESEDNILLSRRTLKNINKPNVKGETPLHAACVKGDIKLVQALLKAGADPNTKDYAKLTPLQEVSSYGYFDICQLLLVNGALPNMPGASNQTALHSAVENNNVREAELLIDFGASLQARDDHGKIPLDYCKSNEMRDVLINAEEHEEGRSLHNATLNTTIIKSDSSNLVVLPVNLDKNKFDLLKTVAVKHKFNVVKFFRNDVTHIVVTTNADGAVDLSYDICLAILHGKWILNFDWINLLQHEDNSDIDFNIFEVASVAHSLDTPCKARENSQNQNPRLFNNCNFYFALSIKSTYIFGNMELTKEKVTKLAIEGEGKILKRMPRPEDIDDTEIVPYHVSDQPDHPLYKCSYYIIYEPGADEPKLKYNMKNVKALPLLWFVESIEKFQLMDPTNYGL